MAESSATFGNLDLAVQARLEAPSRYADNEFMKRFLKCWPVRIVILALVLGGFYYWLYEPRIGPKNYERIQVGWTVAQVDQLLGEKRVIDSAHFYGDSTLGDLIIVEFDDKGRVFDKRYIVNYLPVHQQIYRSTRAKTREALGMQAEP